MKDILARAEELGKLIAGTERFKNLEKARNEAENNSELQAAIKGLNEVSRRIGQLQREGKPIEPEDKRQLRDAQERVTSHPHMQRLARLEADFTELLNRVNKGIHAQLLPSEGESSPDEV